jgi:Tfp pilus assembly protein PilX
VNQIQTLLMFIQSETQLTLDALQERRLFVAALVIVGVVFLLQTLLTLWVVRRLRDVSQLGERVSRLGDGLALLTDTADAGLATVLRQVQQLGRKPEPVKTPRTVNKRVATAARKGQTVARIAQDEALSESEVRLHLAMAAAAAPAPARTAPAHS